MLGEAGGYSRVWYAIRSTDYGGYSVVAGVDHAVSSQNLHKVLQPGFYSIPGPLLRSLGPSVTSRTNYGLNPAPITLFSV